MSVVIETTLGDITVDLFLLERPRACLNFLKLCKMKYYNYNLFHTISRGFIAQTGDPTGSRKGGESLYGVLDGPEKRYFEAENEPRIKHTKMGLISFVGNDDRMIGSQFFITLGEDLTYLDQKHCVFGEVVEGMDTLEIINESICDTDDRPYQDVRITHTVILDDPYPDPRRLKVPSRSPSPSAERLQGGRIAPDEDIDETEGKTAYEIAETQAEREAKARATILEMVGDLPDAEMAPPENVLFVCKLNPITTDDDLEIIFNRFGKIVSCEVIRDKKTGDSLQYAFIEFDDRKSCEDAYFKMDNILIDDRRIHVDFSQSVSKVKWHGKGRGVTHFDESGKRTNQGNKEIGKGNYKLKNERNAPKYAENDRQTSESKRSEENNKENNLRTKNGRNHRNRSRSKSRSPRRREEDPRRRERMSSPRRNRNYRSRSRSPRRRTDDRRTRPNYGDRRREDASRRRYEENKRRNRTPERKTGRDNSRYDRNGSSSSRYHEKKQEMGKYNESRNREVKKPVNNKVAEKSDKPSRSSRKESVKISKHKTDNRRNEDSGSETSGSESEDEKPKKNNKGRNETKKRKESTCSDSDTESESSESEKEKSKRKKKRKDDSSDSSSDEKSKKKKKRRKQSTESDSSESSESESSEDEKNKRRKHKRRTKSSSESESSEEERKKRKKKR